MATGHDPSSSLTVRPLPHIGVRGGRGDSTFSPHVVVKFWAAGTAIVETVNTDSEDGTEPDPRFTFANERTFLAWSRTALALVVAGLGVVQLLPPFPGVPWGRHVLGVPLIAFGAIVAIAAYWEWGRNQGALRHGRPLPRSVLPVLLAIVIAVMAVISAVVLLVSAIR